MRDHRDRLWILGWEHGFGGWGEGCEDVRARCTPTIAGGDVRHEWRCEVAGGCVVVDADGEDDSSGANASRAWHSVDICTGKSVVGPNTFQLRFGL